MAIIAAQSRNAGSNADDNNNDNDNNVIRRGAASVPLLAGGSEKIHVAGGAGGTAASGIGTESSPDIQYNSSPNKYRPPTLPGEDVAVGGNGSRRAGSDEAIESYKASRIELSYTLFQTPPPKQNAIRSTNSIF